MLTVLIELTNWLINAFNGEWLRTADAVPLEPDNKKRDVLEISGHLVTI